MDKPNQKKRMRKMLILVVIVFGSVFIYKGVMKLIVNHYIAQYMAYVPTVSTTRVHYAAWPKGLQAVGSLRAIQGVDVTTSLAGMVKTIYFHPGATVVAGAPLVQLNADVEIATWQSLVASAKLAAITLKRDTAQFAVHAISKATLDTDVANLESFKAQAASEAATVAKKSIKAPFAGRLGISAVNPGQYLNPGDKITTLQQLDPIYVDFYIPQQKLAELKTGLPVNLHVDAFPKHKFHGKITTLNPAVDNTTRNVEVEATIENPDGLLLPGMFADVSVTTSGPARFLTVPAAAVSFNPYGNVIYLVNRDMTVTESFVITGREEGDRIAILKGLSEGDEVVTAGQMKIKNGSKIAINNTVQPGSGVSPLLKNEH